MAKKIDFKKNTYSYNMIGLELQALEDWKEIRSYFVKQSNNLHIMSEQCKDVFGGKNINKIISAQISCLKLLITMVEEVAEMQRDIIVTKCPKLKNYVK